MTAPMRVALDDLHGHVVIGRGRRQHCAFLEDHAGRALLTADVTPLFEDRVDIGAAAAAAAVDDLNDPARARIDDHDLLIETVKR